MGRKQKQIVDVAILPGEPTDGSGRICIHLFVPDERGPFTEPHVLHPAVDDAGQRIKQRVVAKPTRGRLACDPKRVVAPVVRGNVTRVTARTDDPRAVTCPRCLTSPDCIRMIGDDDTPKTMTSLE